MKPFTSSLTKGSFGPDVYRLQILLERYGYGDFVPTGFYGDRTKMSVAMLQGSNNIYPSYGNFGPLTRNFINRIIASSSENLYYTALGCLGYDASPNDVAPDSVGCAETASEILVKSGLDMPIFLTTYQLLRYMQDLPMLFTQVDVPRRGDIVISPTGMGNGRLTSGHVGFMASENEIMSNSSASGTFEQNYTVKTWKERYVDIGGFPVLYFRRV